MSFSVTLGINWSKQTPPYEAFLDQFLNFIIKKLKE